MTQRQGMTLLFLGGVVCFFGGLYHAIGAAWTSTTVGMCAMVFATVVLAGKASGPRRAL